MPKYFDIHSHLNFSDYEKDWDEVIERLRSSETHTIVVGTDYESSQKAVELADKYDEMYASIGVHPIDDTKQVFDREKFGELVKNPKVVAVGECGLDFHHADKGEDYERQKKLFLDHVEFSLEHALPLMIHARDAYQELLEILEPLGGSTAKLRGNVHFFAGDVETARRFINIGFTLSFTGIITFVRDYDEVIKFLPLDMIMSETDAPFASPEPYRGQRNEPSYVSEVVKKIAEIRGEELGIVQKALIDNAFRVFGL